MNRPAGAVITAARDEAFLLQMGNGGVTGAKESRDALLNKKDKDVFRFALLK